jgi:WhiB family redox-sensing transcriptional regulator
MDSALCAQADPEQWTGGTPGGSSRTARRICAHCPVQPTCAAHATALEQHDGAAIRGIWGGHSQQQRRQRRRQAEEVA